MHVHVDVACVSVCAEKFGNRDHVLTIDYVTMSDDAQYSAVATNVTGKSQCSAQLIVDSEARGKSGFKSQCSAQF